MPSIGMYKTWQDLSEPPAKQRTPTGIRAEGLSQGKSVPGRNKPMFLQAAHLHSVGFWWVAWKRCSGRSQQSWYFCARQGGDSRAFHMYKDDMNIEVQRLKKSRFTLTHTDVLIFTVFLSKTRTTFFNRRKAEATTSGPGARCSWREPEVAMWHCAVLRLASTGVG